jgi:hypothetical protein
MLALTLEKVLPTASAAEPLGPGGGPGRILAGVFETLDRAGIPYCVLHGYESYPLRIKSDVDCVIDATMSDGHILALLSHHRDRIGADVVVYRRHHVSPIVLAGRSADGSLSFLKLHLNVDYGHHGLTFYSASQVLASRRRYRQFWIPEPKIEFSGYLARTIAKGELDDERARRLCSLYQQDAAGCEQEAARFWDTHSRELIFSAARSGDWEQVRQCLGELRAQLRRRIILRHPMRFVGKSWHSVLERLNRFWQPNGLSVALLGSDGAGKSSIIGAVGPLLAPLFARWTCRWGPFGGPPLLKFLIRRRDDCPMDPNKPHGLPPRSLLASLMRVGYWFANQTLGYPALHLALARWRLVLYDRHFADILVDPRRYRYSGPLWLLRLAWRLIPKPDLIILLDAPAEVLQARKQEVPFEETARQRKAYLSLVQGLRNGRVVDASRPMEPVLGEVSDIILKFLAGRIQSRFQSKSAVAAGQRF